MDKQIVTAATDLARRHSIPVNHLLAFIKVESSGKAFWPVGKELRPAIRIEGHYFYRLLQGDKRKEAVQLGLAAKSAGAVKNPTTQQGRYEMLGRMVEIDADAAYKSISIGLGQVMVEHYKRLGYSTPLHMYTDAFVSVHQQVHQMVKFITTDSVLLNAVKKGIWSAVANIYNGPAHKGYDKLMEAEVRRLGTDDPAPAVDEYADRIAELGYKDVRSFQKENNLKADGIIGPITREAVDAAVVKIKGNVNAKRNSALKLAGTAIGGSATIAASASSGIDLDQITAYINTANQLAGIDWRIVVGVVGFVGLGSLGKAAYEWWRNRNAPVS